MRFKASAGRGPGSLRKRAPSVPVMTWPCPLLPPFSRGLGSATATPPRGVAQVSRSPATPPSSAPGSGPREGGRGLVRVCVWGGGGRDLGSAIGRAHPDRTSASVLAREPCTLRILARQDQPVPHLHTVKLRRQEGTGRPQTHVA